MVNFFIISDAYLKPLIKSSPHVTREVTFFQTLPQSEERGISKSYLTWTSNNFKTRCHMTSGRNKNESYWTASVSSNLNESF